MENIITETFKSYEGTEKTFSVNGKNLIVPARLDTYMEYRKRFKRLAKACSDKAAEEYIASVNDLESFMNKFPDIYKNNLKTVAEKAVDILISEGIYTVSADDLQNLHIKNYHIAVSDYQTMKESILLTAQNNARATQGLMNGLGSLFNGSRMQGFVKGFNEGAVEAGTKLSQEQKTELFLRIKPAQLFHNVFLDYWNVSISLVKILNANAKDIWLSDSEETGNMETIIKSMSNPNFPQEKILDIIFDIILKNPSEAAVYKLLEEKYGLTDEVKAIFDYFIYPEFNEIVYTEDDFPKQESKFASGAEQNNSQQNTENNSINCNQPNMTQSTNEKSSGNMLKKGLKMGAGVLAAGIALVAMGGKKETECSKNNTQTDDLIRHLEKQERDRKHEEAVESQRQWNAVRKANEERRRKGQPELPLPPRKWY